MTLTTTLFARNGRLLTIGSVAAVTIVALFLLAGCAAPSDPPAPAATPTMTAPTSGSIPGEPGVAMTIEITDTSFSPREISLNVGDTLTVVNTGQLEHSWTSDDGSIDSGFLAPGESFSYTFTTAGIVPFHCEVHPTMTGTLTVNE